MDVLCLRLICSDIYIYSKIYNRHWLARSDHAEEFGRGDERVEGEHQERDEGQPQGAADLPVEGVRAEPRHPQVVARRGRRRRRHQEVRQDLQQAHHAVRATEHQLRVQFLEHGGQAISALFSVRLPGPGTGCSSSSTCSGI